MKKLLMAGMLIFSQLYASDFNSNRLQEITTQQYELKSEDICNIGIHVSGLCFHAAGIGMILTVKENQEMNALGLITIFIIGGLLCGTAIERSESIIEDNDLFRED